MSANKRRGRDRAASCVGKRAYGWLAAIEAAARIRRQTGDELVAYRCRYCRAWHIGHVR